MAKRDFAGMKRDFVEGVIREGRRVMPTLDEIAKAYGGMNASSLRKRASIEKWTAARRKFATKVQQETETARAKAIGSKAAQLDAKAAIIATGLLEGVEGEIARITKKKRKTRSDLAQLKTMGEIAHRAQTVGRVALGQPLDPGAKPPNPEDQLPDVSGATDDELRTLAAGLARLQK